MYKESPVESDRSPRISEMNKAEIDGHHRWEDRE